MRVKGSSLVEEYYLSRKSWIDGTTQFKQLIRSRLTSSFKVLDVGAGSGRGYRHDYRSDDVRLVGVDISPEVLENPYLDEAFCCNAAQMPFNNAEFDLAFSDYVFEHLPDPIAAVREIYRVLKPGGYFLVRTPNKWYYVSLVALLLPDSSHGMIIDRISDERGEEDVFPKFFRCNTEKVMRRTFEQAGFITEELSMVEKEPTYLTFSPLLFRVGVLYEKLVNSSDAFRHFRGNLFGVFRKPEDANDS